MSKSINTNTALMFLVSIMFTYFTADLVADSEGSSAYNLGLIVGGSVTAVLFPLFLVWAARFIFRRKPMFTKGAFVSWWLLFVLLSLGAFFGNMLPPEV